MNLDSVDGVARLYNLDISRNEDDADDLDTIRAAVEIASARQAARGDAGVWSPGSIH